MTIKQLSDNKLIFLGLGSENLALIKWLRHNNFKNTITVWDSLDEKKLGSRYLDLRKDKNIIWKLKQKLPDLISYSLIVRSPGVFIAPINRKKLRQKLTGPMQLFLDFCPTKNIIGVTGSKGKGTTSSLIYNIIKAAKKRVWLGGNIGVAPFSFINKIKSTDYVVLELSSFQLQEVTTGPRIAVITNLTREHLSPADPNNPNHHPSMSDYWQAKLNIIKGSELLIANNKLKLKVESKKLKVKKIYFTSSNLESKLVGEHNKENIAAAVEVYKYLKINNKIISKTVKNFKGLEYRLEKIKEKNDITYYNDSFATTPEATIIALKSFTTPIILLAGGADKKSDFHELAKMINKKVKFLVLFKGLATPRFKKEVIKAGFKTSNIIIVNSMKEAVIKAQKKSAKGDIILMSPACASFGMFKNYKDRGKQFTSLVK